MSHIRPVPWMLFLDDERVPNTTDPDWCVARTVKAAKNLIDELGYPYYMTLDHDLGIDEQTGYDFCHWFVNRLMDDDYQYWNCRFNVHSQNPVGKRNMEALFTNFVEKVYMKKDPPTY